MGRFLGHPHPNPVLFRPAGRAEHEVSHQQKRSNQQQLDGRKISELGEHSALFVKHHVPPFPGEVHRNGQVVFGHLRVARPERLGTGKRTGVNALGLHDPCGGRVHEHHRHRCAVDHGFRNERLNDLVHRLTQCPKAKAL